MSKINLSADKPKIIVVLGPTASGKSDLGIKLARKFNGEIVSADSRQVYRGMDIGTGKVIRDETRGASWAAKVPLVSEGIAHHMLNVVSPKTNFSAGQFVKRAHKAIADIQKRNKIPIIVGGTGFWIDSLVYDIPLPEVKPNLKLRKQLDNKTPAQLFAILKKLDPVRAKDIEKNNPRRLIRAIEIASYKGSTFVRFEVTDFYKKKNNLMILGLSSIRGKLAERIENRLKQRLQQGMLGEVRRLHKQGVSWKRLESFGLEYRQISEYLASKKFKVKSIKNFKKSEYYQKLLREIIKYSKRQMTWFKRNDNIHWVKSQSEAEKLVKKFISNP